jgi:hypothetical protein
VPVLNKPAGEWCQHSCADGCAIHGPRQPEICLAYDCYWRDHDELPEACRPDRIGLVITESGTAMVGHHFLPVVTMQEDFAGAARGVEAAELVAWFVGQGFAAVIIHGSDARVEFDPVRYAGVDANDIESALRYELSQDADELRRLGAVDESYRSLSLAEATAACRAKRQA